MADAVRAPETAETVLLRDVLGVAEVLDQFERAAEGKHFGPVDALDLGGKLAGVAGVTQAIAERVVRRLVGFERLGAQLGEARLDFFLAPADRVANVMIAHEIFLLRQLQTHDVFVGLRDPVDGEAGRVGTAVLQALKHRRHFLADVGGAVAVDEPGNSAHCSCSPYGRQSRYVFRSHSVAVCRNRSHSSRLYSS
jgi:hypothetical protein